MKQYIFQRSAFDWAEKFYPLIAKALRFPAHFGNNANALWDMLTDYVETPCEFVFIGFEEPENEYNRNVLQRIISCFQDFAKENPQHVKVSFLKKR